jgi:3-deoxy-D-arabino-heptulosonate 7-phosphate (DAHP) synthase
VRDAGGITDTEHTIGIFGYPNKPVFLKASSKAEMEEWLGALKVVAHFFNILP